MKRRRRELASIYLDEARRLLDEMHQPVIVKGFSAGKVLKTRLDEPDTMGKRNLMVASAVAIDKSLVLEKFDNPDKQGLALVDAFIEHLAGPKPTEE